MPFVVAAPAAVIGIIGAIWFTLTLLLGIEADFADGILFGAGAFTLLAASHRAPSARITPPPWTRSTALGALCGVAFWLISMPAIGVSGAAMVALSGGFAVTAADRRTAATRRARNAQRAFIVAFALVSVERLIAETIFENNPYPGLGALCALVAAAFLPIDRIQRWAVDLKPNGRRIIFRDIGGYRDEVLAIAAFLAPVDLPKSLAIKAAHEAGPGRARSLRSLAGTALVEVSDDSLNIHPQAQEFARQRMLAEERKSWAARAVHALAESFPDDPRDTGVRAWAERLMPHALTAADWAEKLDVARGAAALLMDQVTGFLLESGRLEEARSAHARALTHARAGFGPTSAEVATIHARMADSEGGGALAHKFALLGDTQLEEGDPEAARRDYQTALVHARSTLGGKHPLVAELRGKMAALPPPSKDEANEKRLVIGCFSLVVAVVLICVGFLMFRGFGDEGMRASEEPLTEVNQLAALCGEAPRYFPDAQPFAGPEPHPVRIFRRSSRDSEFRLEPYAVAAAAVPSTQLVGCAGQTRTGPRIVMCQYPDRPEIPLHQATYVLAIYETRTGLKLGTQTITATAGDCPADYEPPGEDRPWMLYAAPSDEQYRRALLPVEDLLTRPSLTS